MKNYHVSAIDQGDDIIFTHLIEDGSASKSYGIHVAELAGVKIEVIRDAKNKLSELESQQAPPYNAHNPIEEKLIKLDIINYETYIYTI